MKLKSTQFNFVNSENGTWDEAEEWNAIMEEGRTLFSQEELEEFSPDDQTIDCIMNFARSYKAISSRNIAYIDLYMN